MVLSYFPSSHFLVPISLLSVSQVPNHSSAQISCPLEFSRCLSITERWLSDLLDDIHFMSGYRLCCLCWKPAMDWLKQSKKPRSERDWGLSIQILGRDDQSARNLDLNEFPPKSSNEDGRQVFTLTHSLQAKLIISLLSLLCFVYFNITGIYQTFFFKVKFLCWF